MERWFYTKENHERGPISARVLRELADVGELLPQDLVRREGEDESSPAETVKGLFSNPGWFFERNAESKGPVSSKTLQHLAEYDVITPETSLWKEGLSDWVPAKHVTGLFDFEPAVFQFNAEKIQNLYLCSKCGRLITTATCERCLAEYHKRLPSTKINPGEPIGLIGLPCTGKTCYVATLHDQLMHHSPAWRVQVSDAAFDQLTNDYWRMCQLEIPRKTEYYLDGGQIFTMNVVYKDQIYPLVMNDVAGEFCSGLASLEAGHPSQADEQIALFLEYLRQCRGLFVTIPCWDLLAAFGKLPASHYNLPFLMGADDNEIVQKATHAIQTANESLVKIFRLLLSVSNHLKHVEFILPAVDLQGDYVETACTEVRQLFEQAFRVCLGTLKNAGIQTGVSPVSNFGFGNEQGLDPGTGVIKFLKPPQPFGVLEPLRKVLAPDEPQPDHIIEPAVADNPPVSEDWKGKIFLSYRRSHGSETARLLRSSFESAGWKTFLDVEDLDEQFFDDRLLLEIQDADGFVLILTPSALERCLDPEDWLYREIRHAIKKRKRIVPVIKDGFHYPARTELPEEIQALSRINSVEYSHQYYDATLQKIFRHLAEES